MQYYVIASDGQKYGPADIATLASWAQEGRINPETMLESMQDASRVPASSVPGVIAQAAQGSYAAPTEAPQQYANYQRTMPSYGDDGAGDVQKAWIYVVLGFVCCAFLQIGGIYYGNQAKQKGNPGGQPPIIVASILLGLQLVFVIVYVVFLMGMGTRMR